MVSGRLTICQAAKRMGRWLIVVLVIDILTGHEHKNCKLTKSVPIGTPDYYYLYALRLGVPKFG